MLASVCKSRLIKEAAALVFPCKKSCTFSWKYIITPAVASHSNQVQIPLFPMNNLTQINFVQVQLQASTDGQILHNYSLQNQVPPLVAFKIAFKFSIHCVLLGFLDVLHTNPIQMIVSIALLLFLKNLASKYKKSCIVWGQFFDNEL